MNISDEFSKIRNSFERVRADISFISSKLGENYENFMREHYKLSGRVDSLSAELKSQIVSVKDMIGRGEHPSDSSEISSLKAEIKDLKHLLENMKKEHLDLASTIDSIKSGGHGDMPKIKQKLESGELEIYLLKERISKQDSELKHVKEISKHLFDLVSELVELEKEILSKKK